VYRRISVRLCKGNSQTYSEIEIAQGWG